MRCLRCLVLICLWLVAWMPLGAAPESETVNPRTQNHSRLLEEIDKEDAHAADFSGELAQLGLSLGIILAVLLLLSWVVKRFLNTRVEQVNSSSNIKVLEKRYLNPKAVIYLVGIGNKNIIVGESPQGLVNLGEIRGDITEFEKVMNKQSESK